MPGRKLNPAQRRRIVRMWNDGMIADEIAAKMGCHRRTVYRVLQGDGTNPDMPSRRTSTGGSPSESRPAADAWIMENPPPKSRVKDLSREALACLRDFPRWCARYEARRLFACQLRWYEFSRRHQFWQILAPPRHGKSELFSVLRTTWMLCGGGYPADYYDDPEAPLRDRQLLLVSKSDQQAKKNWLAVAARLEGNQRLIDDYGRFRDTRSIWQSSTCQMTIAGRQREVLSGDYSLTVVGTKSGVLGRGATDIVLDDVADLKNCARPEDATAIMDWLRAEIFSRLEPGGTIGSVGARLPLPNDVYAQIERLHYLDADDEIDRTYDDPETEGDVVALFATLVEPAILDASTRTLLAPERWDWRKIRQARALAGKQVFEAMWQQNPQAAGYNTFEEDWILGRNGFPGCIDRERLIGQSAQTRVGGQAVPQIRVASVDPSPTKFWGMFLMDVAQTHLYHPTLIDIRRERLTISIAIDILDRWWREHNLRLLILERNAAHFLLQSSDWRDWIVSTDIRVIEHATSENKAHPTYGIQTLAVDVEAGRVRIPWGDHDTRSQMDDLRREMLGLLPTDDLLLALWFPKWWLEEIANLDVDVDLGRACPAMPMPPQRLAGSAA